MQFKKRIKNIVKKTLSVDEAYIINKCKKYSVISFDIFDTLLVRDVKSPEDVFYMVEKCYNERFSCKSDFMHKRSLAEKKARETCKEEEITFSDIYFHLEGFSDLQKDVLMEYELEAERTLLRPSEEGYKIYDWCRKNNKIIVITSDMYHSKEFLESLLRKNGYNTYDKLYVSSSYGKTKFSGHLFDELINDYDKKEILHIGDMVRSDLIRPRKKGIGALVIAAPKQRTQYFNRNYLEQMDEDEAIAYTNMYKFINNHMPLTYDKYERFGYELMGPLLYGFVVWLEKRRIQAGIDKLFFLAREGKLLQKAYRLINASEDVKCEYIRVSRFATCIPLLSQINSIEELCRFVYCPKAGTIRDLLLSCDFSEEEIQEVYAKSAIAKEQIVHELESSVQENLFATIKPMLNNKSENQLPLILGYLQQKNFSTRCGIVDVGWKGTIHNNLEKLLPDNEIHGYYMGLRRDKAATNNSSELRGGFLFGDLDYVTDIQKRLSSTLSVFENFFLSVDGSTIAYQKNDNGLFDAVLAEPEQDAEGAACIIKIQEAAMKFVEEFKDYSMAMGLSISPQVAFAAYDKFAVTPTLDSVSFMKGFNCFNTTEYSLVASHNLIYYIFHPKKFYRDFMNNTCKVLFMKSVFLIPLPYYKIWEFMHKVERKPINPIE